MAVVDKPRQQPERRAVTEALRLRLADGSNTAEDRAELVRLIREEQAVQEWARGAGEKSSNEQYKRNMKVAETNSTEVERILRRAHTALKNRQPTDAANLLASVPKSKIQGKGAAVNLRNLYLDYLAETDSDFHKWLKDSGRDEALGQLGVAEAPKKKVKLRSSSNQPENYERGY